MRTFLDYMIYLCAFAVIGIGGLGAYDAIVAPGEASQGVDAGPGPMQLLPTPFPGKRCVTVLLIGADDRKERGRSDTIIVMFLNPRRSEAALFSVPRDLRVHIPGHGLDKINHSYFFGGVELTKQTVEKVLGIEIDYYAKADFSGFVEIVDMLGGVDIEVPDVEGRGRGMNYDDNADGLHVHLKPGMQHLDGEQAIGFVRYRKGDSDVQRAERQQQFLKAVAEQKLKLRNVLKLAPVAGKALKCIDTDLSLRESMELAMVLKNLSADNLLTTSIPAQGRIIGGVWYAIYRESDMREALRQIYAHLDSAPAKPCPIEVLNGSGKPGVAAAAGGRLSAEGFEVTDTGNADSFEHQRTLIEYPKGKENTARMIKRILDCGQTVEQEKPPSGDGAAKLRVIIGSDFGEAGE